MPFRKPQLIPLLFIIAAELVTVTLGVWQVNRLAWKKELLGHIESAQAEAPLTRLPKDLAGSEYRNVVLKGTFANDKMMHVISAPKDGVAGFFAITPFKIAGDGRTILVNRGFAPVGKEGAPKGTQTVKGILRPPKPERKMSPANRPDKNVWFFEDTSKAMADHAGTPLLPLIVEEVGPEPARGTYPVPDDGKIILRNDHLQYAITWFGIAFAGLVMFGFYHYIPVKDRRQA